MYRSKNFLKPFTPMYNYHDYMLTWFNTFFFRNFDHLWFFHFHNNIQKRFSMWFYVWFNIFGPLPDILLEQVQEGFHLFLQSKRFFFLWLFLFFHFKNFISFSVPWIMCWDYVFVNDSTLAHQHYVYWFLLMIQILEYSQEYSRIEYF